MNSGSGRTLERRTRVPLLTLVITLIVVGVLLWAVNAYLPMDPKIKNLFAGNYRMISIVRLRLRAICRPKLRIKPLI